MCKSATNKSTASSSKPESLRVDNRGYKSDGKHWASSYDPYDKSVEVRTILTLRKGHFLHLTP